ncbi:MAG: hypothetical protein ACYTFG_00170 [Planctomycetota bacterium]|jgi:hypothetical protein
MMLLGSLDRHPNVRVSESKGRVRRGQFSYCVPNRPFARNTSASGSRRITWWRASRCGCVGIEHMLNSVTYTHPKDQ